MTTLAPLDELRARGPRRARRVLARMAAEHGPAVVAALRYQVEAHRRPAQVLPDLDTMPTVLVITGEYGTGKTQLAVWLTLRAILDWRVERPRIVAATKAAIADTLVHGPSGLLSWLPPWVSRSWQPSTGHAGSLTIDGQEVSCISGDAGANAIGSGAGFVLFDDFAKCVEVLGEGRAEDALVAAMKSLREWPGKMALPTTPDGAEMVMDIAKAEGMRGVEVLHLGRVEDNRGNLARGYFDLVHNLRALDRFGEKGKGAFRDVAWRRYHVAAEDVPPLRRIVVAIDPAKSSRSKSCEVGIVAVGLDVLGWIYGLADRSEVLSSDDWPGVAHQLLEELRADHRQADVCFVAENNAGGDAPAALLRLEEKVRRLRRGEPGIPLIEVREVTARRNDGKARRASEIVGAAKNGQCRMVRGLGVLEGQLAKLVDEGTGTDRADAYVWGARDLAGLGDGKAAAAAAQREAQRTATAASMRHLDDGRDMMSRVDFDLSRA